MLYMYNYTKHSFASCIVTNIKYQPNTECTYTTHRMSGAGGIGTGYEHMPIYGMIKKRAAGNWILDTQPTENNVHK